MEPNLYTQTPPTKDEDEIEETKDVTYSAFRHVESKKGFHIYLSNEVMSDRTLYHKLLHDLRTAHDYDYIVLYLACYGGDVYSGTQIINAMKDAPVPVHVVVDAPCFSMAAVIALQGASLTMKSETFLMFHNYSGGNYGKGHELFTAAAHYDKFHKDSHERQLFPFLTRQEINRLPKDHDVYVNFDDKDLQTRIKRHFKGRKQ